MGIMNPRVYTLEFKSNWRFKVCDMTSPRLMAWCPSQCTRFPGFISCRNVFDVVIFQVQLIPSGHVIEYMVLVLTIADKIGF